MRKQTKVTGRSMSMLAGSALGLAVEMAITLVLCAILADQVLKESISQGAVGYWSIAIVALAAAAGAAVSAWSIKRRWGMVCLVAGALYFLTLLAITAFCFGGEYQGFWATGATILTAVSAVAALGLRRKRGPRLPLKKLNYR